MLSLFSLCIALTLTRNLRTLNLIIAVWVSFSPQPQSFISCQWLTPLTLFLLLDRILARAPTTTLLWFLLVHRLYYMIEYILLR
jgi:hypothetical protein